MTVNLEGKLTVGRFGLPQPIRNPLSVARERAQIFVDLPEPLRSHPIIAADVKHVLSQLATGAAVEMPRIVRAEIARAKGQVNEAISLFTEEVLADPKNVKVAQSLAEELANAGRFDELIKVNDVAA